jgi:HEAT repeat protein
MDPEDAALLQQRLTISWGTRQMCDVLEDLQLALPPGSTFHYPAIANEVYPWTASAHFETTCLRDILDALASPPLSWHLKHGDLTLAYPASGGEAELEQCCSLDALRQTIRSWTRSGLDPGMNEDLLKAIFLHIDNFGDVFLPLPALEDERELRQAVQAQVMNLMPMQHLPARAIAIAGYLGLTACAPDFLTRLQHAHQLEDQEQANPEMIARQYELAALTTALGWMRYHAAVPVLVRLAQRPCRWQVGGVSQEDMRMATQTGRDQRLGFAYYSFMIQRAYAIAALGRIGNPAAIEALEAILRDDRPYAARAAAARALVEAGSVESLPVIRSALRLGLAGNRHEHWTGAMNWEIVAESWALGRLGGRPGVQELLGMLAQAPMRPSLLSALCDLRDPMIAPALLELLRKDQDLASELDESHSHTTLPDASLRTALAAQEGADGLLIAALSESMALTQPWGHACLFVLNQTDTPRAAAWLAKTIAMTPNGQREYPLLVNSLARSSRPEALATLQQLLRTSPDAALRQDIIGLDLRGPCNALTELNHRDELGLTLAWSVQHDPSPLVRCAAIVEGARDLNSQRLCNWATAVLSEADPDVAKQLLAAISMGLVTPQADLHSRNLGMAALILASGSIQADARREVLVWEQRLPSTPASDHLKADIARWEGEPASAQALGRIALALDAFDTSQSP